MKFKKPCCSEALTCHVDNIDKCSGCGWNPAVNKKRIENLKAGKNPLAEEEPRRTGLWVIDEAYICPFCGVVVSMPFERCPDCKRVMR